MLFDLPDIIEILGIFSFATAGAFAAMEKKLDPFGVLILSFVTAIGGGTIRDMLIGDLPVAWLTHETGAWVILTGAVIALFFGSFLKKLDKLLFLFDALGLGLFTIMGIQKAMQYDFHPGVIVALGTITGCFGGVIRDVLLNNVPLIFHKEIYASASIAGGALYLVFISAGMETGIAAVISILFIFVLRLLAVRYNWSLPKFYTREK